MSDDFDISDTERVIHLSSNEGEKCDLCDLFLDIDTLEDNINHYLDDHDAKLLHVGTETISDQNGDPWHTTVATLAINCPF